ncbi:MAG: ATP-binding protein [Eggerthellaceae bacterium]|nr:ATP-binding protein [Eggerthellaceae bacterium]
MIKEDNNSKSRKHRPLFHPAFGSRPQQIIGRDYVIEEFLAGLQEPIGSQQRCTFFLGQRGMGKTALLIELAERAAQLDYIVARVTAYEGMPDEIIETIQREGAHLFKEPERRIQGFEAGALGFSFGLTFTPATEAQYGFRTKLSLLCDELASKGKGVLLLIDETTSSEAMRQVATTYQHLIGEDKNIAIAMAGLPHAVSGVLNDKVLTFLNRARKVNIGPIALADVRAYYAHAFGELEVECPENLLDQAAKATQGFPYLVQLVGYHLVKRAENGMVDQEILEKALAVSHTEMDDNVFKPMLAPLSDNDRTLLEAMAQDEGPSKISNLRARLGVENSSIQPYRARLIDAGLVESPRTGELMFAVPHLAEYLRENFEK